MREAIASNGAGNQHRRVLFDTKDMDKRHKDILLLILGWRLSMGLLAGNVIWVWAVVSTVQVCLLAIYEIRVYPPVPATITNVI